VLGVTRRPPKRFSEVDAERRQVELLAWDDEGYMGGHIPRPIDGTHPRRDQDDPPLPFPRESLDMLSYPSRTLTAHAAFDRQKAGLV
jgi:hypothetical protein